MRFILPLFIVLGATAAHAAPLLDIITKGATDRSVTIRICDSGDGTPETGVVFDTAGIDLWYRREGAASVDITEATLAALTTAHTDGGFLHVNDGEYRLDLPDAAFATGANYVDIGGTVTGMVVFGGRVKLVGINVEDAVRGGMTALPNANAEAAGGLYTRGTGAGQINQPANGMVDVNAVRHLGTAYATPTVAGVPEVDVTHLGGGAQSATDLKDFADDGYDPDVDRITEVSNTLNSESVDNVDVAAIVASSFGPDVDAEILSYIVDDSTRIDASDLNTEIDAIKDGGRLDLIFDDILTDTADIQPKLGTFPDLASGATLAGNLEDMRDNGTAAYDRATDSLQAIRDRGDAAWITATGFSTHNAADVWVAGTRTLTAATNITSTGGTTVPQTGDSFARLGAPAGASLSADIAAIEGQTDDIGAAGAGLTAINLPDQTMNITGNLTGNVSGSVGSVTGAVGSVTGNVGGTINGLTSTAVADFFDVDSGTDYASAVAGSVVKEIADNAGGSGLTEAGIADAVWEEVLSGHLGAGKAGQALVDAGSAGNPWSSLLVDNTLTGSMGEVMNDINDAEPFDLSAEIVEIGYDLAIDLIESLMPADNAPNRTWVMRRGTTARIIAKSDDESPIFWADVSRMLGPTEIITGTPTVMASGCTITEVATAGDFIYCKIAGGTVGETPEVVFTFDDSGGGDPNVARGELRIID